VIPVEQNVEKIVQSRVMKQLKINKDLIEFCAGFDSHKSCAKVQKPLRLLSGAEVQTK